MVRRPSLPLPSCPSGASIRTGRWAWGPLCCQTWRLRQGPTGPSCDPQRGAESSPPGSGPDPPCPSPGHLPRRLISCAPLHTTPGWGPCQWGHRDPGVSSTPMPRLHPLTSAGNPRELCWTPGCPRPLCARGPETAGGLGQGSCPPGPPWASVCEMGSEAHFVVGSRVQRGPAGPREARVDCCSGLVFRQQSPLPSRSPSASLQDHEVRQPLAEASEARLWA